MALADLMRRSSCRRAVCKDGSEDVDFDAFLNHILFEHCGWCKPDISEDYHEFEDPLFIAREMMIEGEISFGFFTYDQVISDLCKAYDVPNPSCSSSSGKKRPRDGGGSEESPPPTKRSPSQQQGSGAAAGGGDADDEKEISKLFYILIETNRWIFGLDDSDPLATQLRGFQRETFLKLFPSILRAIEAQKSEKAAKAPQTAE
jgi:hypothetical protein